MTPPRDFGRLAAATARQVITQLFRRAEDEKVFGAFSGQKGKLITGIIQQDASDPSNVHVAMGDVEAILPRREQVPGERYRHGERIRVYVVNVARGIKGPEIVVSCLPPGAGPQAVRARSAGTGLRCRVHHGHRS